MNVPGLGRLLNLFRHKGTKSQRDTKKVFYPFVLLSALVPSWPKPYLINLKEAFLATLLSVPIKT